MAEIRITSGGKPLALPTVRFGPVQLPSLGRVLRQWDVVLAGVFILALTVTAVLAPAFLGASSMQQNLIGRLQAPSIGANGISLGTDALGRSLAARLLYGARYSLGIALAAALLAASVGTLVGTLAGWRKGRLDKVISAVINIQLSLPFLLLALTLAAVARPNPGSIVLVMAAAGWAGFARMARAEALRLSESGFVEAALALGQRQHRIFFQHIIPNLLPTMIVLFSLELARFIVLESSLSFLGVGVSPSTPTWGGMINEGREYLATHFWLSTLPGLCVFFTCLSLNVLGDWAQERYNPYSTTKEGTQHESH